MRRAHVVFAAIAGVALSVQALAAQVAAPSAPLDKGAVPPTKGATVASLGGRLTVPAGFKVAYFSDSATVPGARFMAMGPDGAVYVSRPGNLAPREGTPPNGQVVRLFDKDGDGVAEERTVAVSEMLGPHGLAFHNGWLYIAALRGVYRVKLGADGKALGAPEQLNSYNFFADHSSRTIIFGSDNKMYVAIGSSCNLCIDRSPELAAVSQYDENGKNGRIFSAGLRNAVGVAENPVTHEIWVTQNERDDLMPDHQNLPSEEINILKDGAHYGWPFCHDDRVPNPEFKDSTAFCAKTVPPAFKMQGHTAPLGITFLDKATQFPADYRGDALVALHGSWDRDVPVGVMVARIHVTNGKPTAYEAFVTGWQADPRPRPVDTTTAAGGGRRGRGSGIIAPRWGRPVDVMVYKDGSVLISDDQRGAIYRVYR